MKSNLIDVEVVIHHETTLALLISTDGERKTAIWVPKAAVQVERKGRGTYTITLPVQMAEDKGLV